MTPAIQYIHLPLERGDFITLGYDHHSLKKLYDAPDLNKLDSLNLLEIRVAVSCCSHKDRFEKKKAHIVIADKMKEGTFIMGHQQRIGGVWERSYDAVIRAFNAEGGKLLPESWRRRYPNLKLVMGNKIEVTVKPQLTYRTDGNKITSRPLSHEETLALVDRYKSAFGSR